MCRASCPAVRDLGDRFDLGAGRAAVDGLLCLCHAVYKCIRRIGHDQRCGRVQPHRVTVGRRRAVEQRIEMMSAEDLSDYVSDMREDVVDDLVAQTMPEKAYPEQWALDDLKEGVAEYLNLDLPVHDWANEEGIDTT